ncbi:uncharacterized protein MONOS_7908 [Monocercomonoides exilis]|uniref:uncharacterized protein n=1 Tax=Monocercomonoides exilis TaxID=2049356 RepID=UPI003559D5D3|nr:hypothetical protein MONOS_7908 [Monocercomonoides exilis]|eukprot:MONOS_7908.1-p1 / transcript=MONOS_7908.1 / gene=MONOS_7908 / organism=Monocercomonoides_exilis_PA203 / gene_product=unspecified product / transcript_product=unspecified product / location=Mono_scaffold00283:70075-71369(+) / protein_length=363 / sequence_SO=supercontig / SO=protein_coding / is_pseudo=false
MLKIEIPFEKNPEEYSPNSLKEQIKIQLDSHSLFFDGRIVRCQDKKGCLTSSETSQSVEAKLLSDFHSRAYSSVHCEKTDDPSEIGLGDDILRIVFSHADPETLSVLPRVCKRWKRILDDQMIWRDVLYHMHPQEIGILEKDVQLLYRHNWRLLFSTYQRAKKVESDATLRDNLCDGLKMIIKLVQKHLPKVFPTESASLVCLASALEQRGIFDSESPTIRAKILCNLGALSDHLFGDSHSAEGLFRTALVLNNTDSVSLCNLGALLQNSRHRVKEAEDCYIKAMNVQPSYWVPYSNLAFLRYKYHADIAGARALFQKALERGAENSRQIQTWLNLHPAPPHPSSEKTMEEIQRLFSPTPPAS